jgi:hypothetical protein
LEVSRGCTSEAGSIDGFFLGLDRSFLLLSNGSTLASPDFLFFRALCPCVTESLEVTMTSPLPLIFRVVRCTLVASCDSCLDQLD